MAPVCVGSALAIAHHGFALVPALAALSGALLLQIGVNLSNDYFDFIKCIDTKDRVGPMRVTQSGLISPGRVKAAMWAVFGLCAAVGMYLTQIGGWPILAVGIASILAALAYSGGPYPLASHGLGDLFVFIFFGPVAVCGTYYVQVMCLDAVAVWASVPVGLLITAILVVNNLRDIDTDRRAGKRTLAVMIGPDRARIEYALLVVGAYITLPSVWMTAGCSVWILTPMLSLPIAWREIRSIYVLKGAQFNRLLAGTARLAFVFSLLLSAGLIILGMQGP